MSNRLSNRLVHKLFGKLCSLAAGHSLNIEIERDPLGRRYSVNRFGIVVFSKNAVRIRNLFVASLVNEGWQPAPNPGHSQAHHLYETTYRGRKVSIGVSPVNDRTGEGRFEISPYIWSV